MSRDWVIALRRMISTTRRAWTPSASRSSSCAQPTIAVSGPRSSCATNASSSSRSAFCRFMSRLSLVHHSTLDERYELLGAEWFEQRGLHQPAFDEMDPLFVGSARDQHAAYRGVFLLNH